MIALSGRLARPLSYGIGIAVILLALTAIAFGQGGASGPQTQASPAPSPRHADPNTAPRAEIVYPAVGGPFISEQSALSTATRLASGPVTRTAIGRVSYSVAAAWMHSATYTIDPARQVYLVVVQAPFSPQRAMANVSCAVFFAVVDATDGTIRADGCRDLTGEWPTLPAGVH